MINTKKFAMGVIAATLLAGTAMAQTPMAPNTSTTTTTTPMASSTTASTSNEWRASKLVGVKVYNSANENVGDINDLLMDAKGNVKQVVIGVGGFLGMGEHDIAVNYDQVKFVDTPVPSASASTSTTKSTSGTVGSSTTTTTTTTKKWFPDHAVFNATKDELKAMPQFKYNQ
jgi:sporulation protein YlmC with PRC-barrel domain